MAGLFVAELHESENKLLVVHKSLVQKDFGIRARKGQGRCLVTQVAYTVEAVFPKLRASRVAAHIDNLNNYQFWNFHPYPQRSYSAELKWDL